MRQRRDVRTFVESEVHDIDLLTANAHFQAEMS